MQFSAAVCSSLMTKHSTADADFVRNHCTLMLGELHLCIYLICIIYRYNSGICLPGLFSRNDSRWHIRPVPHVSSKEEPLRILGARLFHRPNAFPIVQPILSKHRRTTWNLAILSVRIWCLIKQLCTWRHNMPPPHPLYARCGPPPVHSLHALHLRFSVLDLGPMYVRQTSDKSIA